MIVTAGSTDKSVYFYIVGDASHASTDDPITDLLYSDIETGGSASYVRQGAARVDLTLITLASASATHADGGFILVDATNMPGFYRCDYPDAAFATGVDEVSLQLVVASAKNARVVPINVQIFDMDVRDSVRAGLTALPNAAADAAGGLPISDDGGLDIDEIRVETIAILVDTGTTLPATLTTIDGIVDAILVDTGTTLDGIVDAILVDTAVIGTLGAGLTDLGGMSTAMQTEAEDAVWDAARASHLAAASFGASYYGFIEGLAKTGTLTTTVMTTDLGEVTDDHFIGRTIVFLGGVLHGQATDVTDYSGTNGTLTYSTITESPVNDQRFILV